MSRLAGIIALALCTRVTHGALNMSAPIPNANDTAAALEAALAARNLAVDVFSFPVALTTIPSLQGIEPAFSTSVENITISNLLAIGYARNANSAVRVRGRLRSSLSGTHAFSLLVDAGGALSVSGAVLARGFAPGEKIVGKLFLSANEDYEIECMGYRGDRGEGFTLTLEWSPPGTNAWVEVPSEAFYAPLDSSCDKTCGNRAACRVADARGRAECFDEDVVDASNAVTSLEALFAT